MSFLAGPECSTGSNPLSQFSKHVQGDRTLQRDRLLGGGRPGSLPEDMHSAGALGPSAENNETNKMMDAFMAQNSHLHEDSPSPFAMENLHQELDRLTPVPSSEHDDAAGVQKGFQQPPPPQAPPPVPASWTDTFDSVKQANSQPAFHGITDSPSSASPAPVSTSVKPEASSATTPQLSPAEFAAFQSHRPISSLNSILAAAAPWSSLSRNPGLVPMETSYGLGANIGMLNPPDRSIGVGYQTRSFSDTKGKGRVIEEVDGENWEEHFAAIDAAHQDEEKKAAETERDSDTEANEAIEKHLDDLDRSVSRDQASHRDRGSTVDYDEYERLWQIIGAETNSTGNRKVAEELDIHQAIQSFTNNRNFDADDISFDNDLWREYMLEEENIFSSVSNPYEEGVRLLREQGNLSLAALAFEAAVKKDPTHVEAWTRLGSTQAQNEKEPSAVRALGRALSLDPNNATAMMNIAVSYTNEGDDNAAFLMLERWLNLRYPQVVEPSRSSRDRAMDFFDRGIARSEIINLFIKAAQLSPSGDRMDPDVQVGLGVLFYGSEEYDKAIDCFRSALASTEGGASNQEEQVHLLWNHLGATLANSGRPEEAIEAYEKALTINPNFVRARYNLGISCINIGCLPEAAQHMLGSLAMHQLVEREGRQRAREIAGGHISDEETAELARVSHNQSTSLYDTLRRVFAEMDRSDLCDRVHSGMDLQAFRDEFEF